MANLTMFIRYSKALGTEAIMYQVVNRALEGLPGYEVEYGDFDVAYIDEIVKDHDRVATIVVSAYNFDIWAAVCEYCKNNHIEYLNTCG